MPRPHIGRYHAREAPGSPPRRTRRGGFTLIELLSAMTIIGVLASVAVPKFHEVIERARVAKAIGDLKAITTDLLSSDSLPGSLTAVNRHALLDPWGRPYVYVKFPGPSGSAPPGGARVDRFAVAINSAFDLYSMGKDGVTTPSLTAAGSRDDVVVANDGGFAGAAKAY